jgi:hypothetical protein
MARRWRRRCKHVSVFVHLSIINDRFTKTGSGQTCNGESIRETKTVFSQGMAGRRTRRRVVRRWPSALRSFVCYLYTGAENRISFEPFCTKLKTISLPRQAWDKHIARTQKEMMRWLCPPQGVSGRQHPLPQRRLMLLQQPRGVPRVVTPLRLNGVRGGKTSS